MESASKDPWVPLALKAGTTTLLHPVEYAKVLMQLGHEPVAPVPSKSMFGRPILALPNVFKYIGIIRKRDGFSGMYAGVTPRLIG